MRDIRPVEIAGRKIGIGFPAYVVAEMSANHNGDFDAAAQIVRSAKEAGADAVKLQAYTPDTLTIDCDAEAFRIPDGNAWSGRTLHDLYSEAYTPWDWIPQLQNIAHEVGIDLFATAFDAAAVDLLEDLEVSVHKIASFELVDLALIRKVAETGKPLILSTGLATLAEIDEAVRTAWEAGCTQLVLMECTSSYPASPADSNLRTIPHLAEMFGVPTGLSDHTLGTAVAIGSVALGACVVEKHFKLEGNTTGPDAAFSINPEELRQLVDSVRAVEQALGDVDYGLTDSESGNRCFRRSLFVVEDVSAGEVFTDTNTRSIRPGYGLSPKYLPEIIGRRAARDVLRGEPVSWDLIVQ